MSTDGLSVEGKNAHIILDRTPPPWEFEHRSIVTPDAPKEVFWRLQNHLSDYAQRGLYVRLAEPEQPLGRVYFDADNADLYVEGVKPVTTPVSEGLYSWRELGPVERVWLSAGLIGEDAERHTSFEEGYI